MPLKIVRNDITQMNTDAIVNTANEKVLVGPGCDYAIYNAAGYQELLAYRRENIGNVAQGEVFLTPAFQLPCKYIIHAVSPLFQDGSMGEEKKLRSCYRKSLELAHENEIRSIAFPLIATGSFGYPKEEGMRIAVDEINAFLMKHQMLVYLVVFDQKATELGKNLYPDLQSYINERYVEEQTSSVYGAGFRENASTAPTYSVRKQNRLSSPRKEKQTGIFENLRKKASFFREEGNYGAPRPTADLEEADFDFDEFHGYALEERMNHLSDTFSEYLIYLIDSRGLTYPDVYKRAIIDKKAFSKIKNNPNAHPKKITAMCLCIGAKLNMDQTRDLLARAGYALSPCDKTDIIFSYFIEHGIYDMIELDIQLEEHGLPCLIS